ncbi:MAG: hypothetical protein NC236_02890 [Mycoplasma sp.]|nr:hypothetical protein [Mycoplasma sp.]
MQFYKVFKRKDELNFKLADISINSFVNNKVFSPGVAKINGDVIITQKTLERLLNDEDHVGDEFNLTWNSITDFLKAILNEKFITKNKVELINEDEYEGREDLKVFVIKLPNNSKNEYSYVKVNKKNEEGLFIEKKDEIPSFMSEDVFTYKNHWKYKF